MHTEALTQAQRDVLDRIASLGQLADFYLAGGTALALRHGHRRSIDFDWFRESAVTRRLLAAQVDDL